MQHTFLRSSVLAVAMAAMVSTTVPALAQSSNVTVPDAQVEANVLKALADAPQLANQSITSTTVFGTVTLTGTVQDETSRDLADKLVSNTAGVKKVLDQMTVGSAAATAQPSPDQPQQSESNPNLQSDGSVAHAAPMPSQNGPQQQFPTLSNRQSMPQNGGPAYGSASPQQPYPPQYGRPQRPYIVQKGGDAVVVPTGSVVRVRINQGMDSKNTAVGTAFDGVILNNVFANGFIAIPRGASVRGTVVESHRAGGFKGKGELKLQLTQLIVGGRVYPIVTDFWWHQGADKTANSVGNTVGLGAMGALIGAVAGGGVGAAVGAGIGGVAGLGVSASSQRGEAALPAEAILSFHLTQPADVTTVPQAELNRLRAGLPQDMQPQMRRQFAPPPYPYPYPPPPPPPPPYYYPAPY